MPDNPTLEWLDRLVWPPIDGLEGPPDGNVDEIVSVEMDAVRETAKDTDHRECQECGEPVAYAEPHVKAIVWVEGGRTGPRMKRPIFCDRECWASWASSAE